MLKTEKDLQVLSDKVAELFEFPAFQFYITMESNEKLRNAIQKRGISFYEDAIKRLNALSSEESKRYELAKLQRVVFGESGISSDEVQKLCERMDDMYYR